MAIERHYTTAELAEMIGAGITARAVAQWCRRGMLRCARPPRTPTGRAGHFLIPHSAAEAFLASWQPAGPAKRRPSAVRLPKPVQIEPSQAETPEEWVR
jgi:hypothetical protein